MLIDSHCHLDAQEFDADRAQVWAQAQSLGVVKVVIPAVHPDNFATVAELAHQVTGAYYALGIHPMYVRYCAQAESIDEGIGERETETSVASQQPNDNTCANVGVDARGGIGGDASGGIGGDASSDIGVDASGDVGVDASGGIGVDASGGIGVDASGDIRAQTVQRQRSDAPGQAACHQAGHGQVFFCEPALKSLETAIIKSLDDPLFVGIGEIGLDFFIPEISQGIERERQEFFYQEQLKMAQRYDLPVILHVRRSQDSLLKYLRQIKVRGGIAHAFNGSMQQAQAFVGLGFCLGFGGTLTYARSLQIRRLATGLDLAHIVLETDAPDIPPAFLTANAQGQRRNSPEFLPRIARELADLRGTSYQEVVSVTGANVQRVLTRMA